MLMQKLTTRHQNETYSMKQPEGKPSDATTREI